MKPDKKAFEKMMRDLIGEYLKRNMGCMLKGSIRIEDDGEMVKIYRKCEEDLENKYYDIGIVY